MNKVILTGNLVRDIEEKQTQGGNNVVSNCIAVRRDFKNPATNEYETDFINFVAWGAQATYLKNFANKGDKAELVGRWQVRSYQDQYNNTRQVNEVVVESITVYSTKPTDPQQETTNQPNEINESDLPF